jgi:DNA-binding CsgD family transcriptional regulator
MPRGSADMLGTVVDYSPLEGAFQGGRMAAEGVQTMQPHLVALGAFFASPPGMGLGTFIGLPGARRLAFSGRGNAQEMLNLAATMEARGATLPEIQATVSRRLATLRDADFGTVTRLPDGQWAIELANVPARHGRLSPYEVRPLGDVRPDPLLHGAHPELRTMPVWHNPDLTEQGMWGYWGGENMALHRGPSTLGTPRILEHEVQHATSFLNRFPGGATPQMYAPGGRLEHLRPSRMTPEQAYHNTADEWLAEQSAQRMYMPAAARRESPVVAPEGLIVHHWDETASESGMARPRAWTQERLEEVKRQLEQGRTRSEIATEIGVSPVALDRALERYGSGVGVQVLRAQERHFWRNNPEKITQLQELWNQNLPVAGIASEMGISEARVRSGITVLRQRLGTEASLPRRHTGGGPGRDEVLGSRFSQHLDTLLTSVRRLEAQGYSGVHIAQELGISHDFVLRLLRSYGRTDVSSSPLLWSQRRMEDVKEMIRQGRSRAEIAAHYNITPSALSLAILRSGEAAGLSVRSRISSAPHDYPRLPHPASRIPVERLVELYEAGKTMSELAEIFKVHPHTIRSRLRAAGIQTGLWGGRRVRTGGVE